MNPSRASASPGIALAGIYRITSHGVRDLCQLQGVESAERPEEPHRPKPAFPSRKKKTTQQKAAENEKTDPTDIGKEKRETTKMTNLENGCDAGDRQIQQELGVDWERKMSELLQA